MLFSALVWPLSESNQHFFFTIHILHSFCSTSYRSYNIQRHLTKFSRSMIFRKAIHIPNAQVSVYTFYYTMAKKSQLKFVFFIAYFVVNENVLSYMYYHCARILANFEHWFEHLLKWISCRNVQMLILFSFFFIFLECFCGSETNKQENDAK